LSHPDESPARRSKPEARTPPRPRTLLFLCTGNYYRSRFAEVFFNHHGARMGLPWRAVSRGLAIHLGVNNVGPLSAAVAARLVELGIPQDAHVRLPAQVTEADLARADLIVAVKEAEHRPQLRERFPAWEDRVEFWHIHDLDGATPREALPCLEQQVLALAHRLREGGPARTPDAGRA
jgi:protein-tyrosine phosphatase